jgi:hypothetical protein
LKAPFQRAVAGMTAWGKDVARTFPHADVEFFPDAGSRGRTGRAALRIMFSRAVIGDAARHAQSAGFWVTAEHNTRGEDVTFAIRPYRGPDDKFGASNKSSLMPRLLGFGPRLDWWTYHGMALVDDSEGFRREFYNSADGRLPREMRHDLNSLYYNGYRRGLLEDPVAVLAALPPRPGFIPE